MPVESSILLVLRPLLGWTQDNWRELATAMTFTAFNATFERIFAPGAHIAVNGEPVTRNRYKELLSSSFGIGSNNTCKDPGDVDFLNVLEIPPNDIKFVKAGEVGLVYNATCTSGTSSAHLSIERTGKCPKYPEYFHGYCDPRRVVRIDQLLPVRESPSAVNISAL
ncbi:hypothetical protein C8R46DRAFT_1346421 [Mycena filopes]|nr:hypothetical protein C8R46DRAFT_1346421 [Mycena filopes]